RARGVHRDGRSHRRPARPDHAPYLESDRARRRDRHHITRDRHRGHPSGGRDAGRDVGGRHGAHRDLHGLRRPFPHPLASRHWTVAIAFLTAELRRGSDMNAYARVATWVGLIVAMGTALAMITASRTSPMLVAPRAAAEAVGAETRPAWQMALDTMDRALVAGDISGAEMAWRNAYGFAIRSRQWEALIAAGDGSL